MQSIVALSIPRTVAFSAKMAKLDPHRGALAHITLLLVGICLQCHPSMAWFLPKRCNIIHKGLLSHVNNEDLPLQRAELVSNTPEQKQTDSTRRGVLASPLWLWGVATTGTTLGFTESASALDDYENRRIAIFEKASPSVVFIDTFTERRDAFSTNVLEVPLGSGSGFVWDTQGHIVTNFHVVRNAQVAQIAILTSTSATSSASSSSSLGQVNAYTSMRPASSKAGNKRSVFKAQVVGVDPGKDIAVLKVDAPKELLTPLKVGSSANLRVGQSVLAIGNPFGLDHSLTSGIISGLGREVKSPIGRPITNVVQIDAAINPGNSGGPLLDSSGSLNGMNTAIYSPSGASAGVGFAIPIDSVKSSK